jgi:iron complex outermembrane receptor protein
MSIYNKKGEEAMTLVKKSLLAACAFVVTSQVAYAQTPSEPSASADLDGPGGEIIVTAQRRSERARDVPLSITARSAEDLANAGVSSVRDLTLVTPGLKFDTGGAGFVLPSIRGVTTNISGAGVEANIGIYVDGVYQTSQLATTFDLPDIERLEVAKGPQGTLFGRNATGGAIQVFTRQPSLTEASGDLTVGYGSFNERLAQGFVTAPLIADRLAFSLSGFLQQNDGYLHDAASGRRIGELDSSLFRAKLLWEVNPDLRFTLAGQYMDRRDDSSPNGQALDGNTVANIPGSGNLVPTDPYQIALSLPGYSRVEGQQVSLTGEWETEIGTFTSITAYQTSEGELHSDTDFGVLQVSDVVITQPDDSLTQELVFSSAKFGPLQFVTGLYYIWHRGQFDPLIANDVVYLRKDFRTESVAAFGEVSLDLTDRLTAIAGLRYSTETVDYASSFGLGAPAPTNRAPSETFDAVTPRLSFRYALDADSNVYFTYSRGFKSGGVDTTDYVTGYSYEPETIDAYELGVKSRVTDWLDLSLAGFYYKYQNQQQLGLIQVCFGSICAPTAVFLNASSARIYGLDFEATATLTDSLSLSLGISALNARYEDFPNALISRPTPGPEGGNVPMTIDASGNHMIRAPDFTASLAATYRTQLEYGELALSGLLYYTSDIYYDFEERVHQPAYTTVNLRAEFTPANSELTFAVYGKNLLDETIIQSTYINDNADGVSFAPPRSFGVSATYRF